MPRIAVSVAVFNEGQILLTKRDDFEVWCLPSGGVEWSESVAQAAIRETLEETGIVVELEKLVGVYSRIGAIPDIHAVHFKAVPVDGHFRTQLGETLAVKYFPIDNLPENLVLGHGRRIADSIVEDNKARAVVQILSDGDTGSISYEEVYSMRDESNLSPSDFYDEFISSRMTGPEIAEV